MGSIKVNKSNDTIEMDTVIIKKLSHWVDTIDEKTSFLKGESGFSENLANLKGLLNELNTLNQDGQKRVITDRLIVNKVEITLQMILSDIAHIEGTINDISFADLKKEYEGALYDIKRIS